MKYQELKKNQSERMNSFSGIFFAFSNTQFAEGLKKLNCEEKDIYRIFGGGFVLKTKAKEYRDMFASFDVEMEKAMKDDSFLQDAIEYELSNHEYGITYDVTDTVECLDIDLDDERTNRIFLKARKKALESFELCNQ